jgi:hypothetical protein
MGPVETADVDNWGQFTLIRPFVLERTAAGEAREGINGFIVQLIERETNVTVHEDKPRFLKTSEDISTFTGGNIQNASDSYYELFVVENGVVLDRDQFQSGPVLRYVGIYANDDPPTSGSITIAGTSVFVRSNPVKVAEVKTAMERAEAAGATRASTRFRALGEKWDTFAGTPANGLPYLDETVADLLALAASNVLKRRCTVKWTRDGKTALEEITDPKSVLVRRRTGGSIRGRTASKSSRTRGTGRAKSRSSRRARVRRYRTARRGLGTSH